MALLTGLRKTGLHVVWLRGALEIFQVTAHTSSVGAGQVVIAIHMALRALYRRMRPG
jgi:hypothetical protein